MKCSAIQISLLGAAALCLAVPTRPAAAHSGDGAITARSAVIVRSDAPPGAAGQAHSVEITTSDGKVQVRVDGKEISADRLRFDGGRVVVLDEDGNEVKALGLIMAPGHADHLGKVQAELEEMEQAPPPVMLGIQMSDPDEALRRHLHLEPEQTSLIFAIYDGLPARKGGLEQYDIIVALNGKRPAGPKAVRDFLSDKSAGDQVRLTVIHDGQTVERTITLEAYDAEAMKVAHGIGMMAPNDKFEWAPGQDFQFKGLFDPNSQQWFKMLNESGLADQIKEQLRGQLPQDMDSRLERLDQRIDEIKKLIDALIEQAREIAKESQGPGSR